MPRFIIHPAICLALVSPTLLAANELDSVPAKEAVKWGARMAELASKIEKPQVKIEADAEKANGVHVPDVLGLIVVPQKDLKESEELAAKFREEPGVAIGYLFTYHVVPVTDGKPADHSHLRTLEITDEQGEQHSLYVYLLAARQIADDDYRLHVYGAGPKPLVDAKFSEGTGPGPEPVAIQVTNVDEDKQEGTVVVTVFGKYQARFSAGHKE